MNTEVTISNTKEIFKNKVFGEFITTAKRNLVSLEKKANDVNKFNAFYIAFFDNNKNINSELIEDFKRHEVTTLKDYVQKELAISKSQYYNLLAVGKLLELDDKGTPHYKDTRLENFNTTAVGLLINKCPQNEKFEDYINRLFSVNRITDKMTNNDIRKALKDKVVASDKAESKKADSAKDTDEKPEDTLNKLAIDFENFYCKIVGTKFKAEHEVDLNALHRIFEKYTSKNPFEDNKQ